MRPIAFITLAFAPVVAMAMYFYLSRRNSKSFQKILIQSFLCGMAGIVVLIIAKILSYILGLNDLGSLKRILF